ncbi:MAG TPA: type 4a pilus biogenesis protein PilO [Polyangiaceae bacterium]|jgi:type IV pilus assembly protein PilO|nr:MAG: Pilus assembly protein, PilO [Deltaproteobacteria bacterium ADurb.Bin207]HNS98544.1 type 4a pilus biogenesis protein PilO [Polyangiaceae bacterium]HNZ24874.1 type 4a pilus biogenesis protein PilO [Polyangiaceae bacterium]HOD24594.1 type 4a pilus biogenesis protein PilO [Polyangiaceae bacterium]HOE50217.1 type 4a pilus biogenesis protein PilO [Polyangiaceae bacterium]
MAAAKSSALSRIPTVAKFGIGLGFGVLTAIAYFIIFYSDVSSAIRSAKSQEGTLRNQLADARKIEVAYQQDLGELNDRQQRQREFNKVLPESASYPAFLSSIQGVANVSGVNLMAWAPMEESSQEFYAKVPMKLKLTGRFHQIAKFFYGVGQLDRIINIEDIELLNPKVTDEDITIEVNCLATAFRSLPMRAPAAPEANPGGQ